MELRIDNVRNVFSNIATLRSGGNDDDGKPQKEKYSGSFIVTPANPGLAKIEAITKSLLTDKYGATAKGIFTEMKAANTLLIHSGDEKATREEYVGNFFFSASTKATEPPKFYHKVPKKADGTDNLLTMQEATLALYGGSYINVKVDIYVFDMPGKARRICAQLLAAQPFRDGDRFSRTPPTTGNDWDDVSTGEEKAAAATGGAW